MVFRLICFIAAVVLLAFYTGFNLDNKGDIWFFFTTFKNVPVFMNSLISFAFGILCALPFAFVRRYKKSRDLEEKEKKVSAKKQKKLSSETSSDVVNSNNDESSNSKRKSILDKIQKLKKQPSSAETKTVDED
ncbi:hypothetical protein [Treponema sp.]|uniref:hypothetical protein n=1 Tax=Treponema sp. TaxID=166 RepID=UPI00298E05A4|nr:hypothetical protein [Treponema sp.]MCR5612945.1 hypothetical protein [Treponema sp.]